MNYDTFARRLITSLYECLQASPESIDEFYSPDAKVIVCIESGPEQRATSDRHRVFVPGSREILRWNGQKNGDNALGHFTGLIRSPDVLWQANEMVIFSALTDPFLILYHSLHLTSLGAPPEPEPIEPEPEIEPPPSIEPSPTLPEPAPSVVQPISKASDPISPIQVDHWKQLMRARTILATNMPFNREQSDVLSEFEVYGPISRYATERGKIFIEFVNPDCVRQAMNDGDFEWSGRTIRIKPIGDIPR